MSKNKHKCKSDTKITVDKTGVITYYAVTLGEIDYTVTDMYDVNTDYTERTFLELETQNEPSIEIQNKTSQAMAEFEANS